MTDKQLADRIDEACEDAFHLINGNVSLCGMRIHALAAEVRTLQKGYDRVDAGVEMEHIQNTGETFPMTIARLTASLASAHSQNCYCHPAPLGPGPCTTGEDVESGGHEHPWTDPDCEKMRG